MIRTAAGRMPDGQTIEKFRLVNAQGHAVSFLTLGGIITEISVPDREGRLANVTLGCRDVADYVEAAPFFGCITGRYANRIGGASFVIDGETFEITATHGPNTLHGGKEGFNRKLWEAEPDESGEGRFVTLRYTSPDGEEGFPGRLETTVRYGWTDEDDLVITYEATTDRPTVLNLTNHAYFNLAGESAGSVLDHEIMIPASRFVPTDDASIPTGGLAEVEGTPLDFRTMTRIGERIREPHPQIRNSGGYDKNYVIDGWTGSGEPLLAAVLHDPLSGRRMETRTTEPGIQLYTGNYLGGSLVGSSGRLYRQGDGLALETQHFPDSPNQPDFPSTVLRPGETFRSTTIYSFGVGRGD